MPDYRVMPPPVLFKGRADTGTGIHGERGQAPASGGRMLEKLGAHPRFPEIIDVIRPAMLPMARAKTILD